MAKETKQSFKNNKSDADFVDFIKKAIDEVEDCFNRLADVRAVFFMLNLNDEGNKGNKDDLMSFKYQNGQDYVSDNQKCPVPPPRQDSYDVYNVPVQNNSQSQMPISNAQIPFTQTVQKTKVIPPAQSNVASEIPSGQSISSVHTIPSSSSHSQHSAQSVEVPIVETKQNCFNTNILDPLAFNHVLNHFNQFNKSNDLVHFNSNEQDFGPINNAVNIERMNNVNVMENYVNNDLSNVKPTFKNIKIKNLKPKIGKNFNVSIAYIKSIAEFYLHINQEVYDQIHLIQVEQNRMIDKKEGEMTQYEVGMFCASKYTEDNQWYRAQIIRLIYDPLSGKLNQVEVKYIDWGNNEKVTLNRLMKLSTNLIFPMAALKCRFATLEIRPEMITTESTQEFKKITQDVDLKAIFLEVAKNSDSNQALNDWIYFVELSIIDKEDNCKKEKERKNIIYVMESLKGIAIKSRGNRTAGNTNNYL